MILFWSSVTASLGAVAGCLYLVAATILVGRSARKRAYAGTEAVPGVTVLKPLHGDEPGLLKNLNSFCTQDYPGRMQVVFGVQDTSDAAVAVVKRLQNIQADTEMRNSIAKPESGT